MDQTRAAHVTGTLYVVATPIGNLKDITLRAIETLKAADVIACEDTRHASILLKAHGIATPTVSYHSHSGQAKTDKLIEALKEGKQVALISDAGMPGISDPGAALIRDAVAEGIKVSVVPGASASLCGLVLSGFPTDKFVFEGFLPVKSGSRGNRLKQLSEEERTIVLYEGPHRLVKLLAEIQEVFGDIPLSVSREITKMFEETLRSRASQLLKHFEQRPPKGEFVVVIPPKRDRANGQ